MPPGPSPVSAPEPCQTRPRSPARARRYAVRRGALGRRDQHRGETGRTAQFLPPAINLTRRNVGAARHIGDDRARRQTRGDDRPLLFLGPAPPPFRAGDHLNSRHRTVSCTGASTVICTSATTSPHPAAQGGPQRRVTIERRIVALKHQGRETQAKALSIDRAARDLLAMFDALLKALTGESAGRGA